MQAIATIGRPAHAHLDAEEADVKVQRDDWMTMYKSKPTGNRALFELEALVAKRMELLAWIDQMLNAPEALSYDEILDEIGCRLPEERRSRASGAARSTGTVLGSVPTSARSSVGRRSGSRGGAGRAYAAAPVVVFEGDEDLVSQLLCRFAFCLSEKWRKWLVRTEETLLRARLKLETGKDTVHFLVALMKRNGLACAPLSEALAADPVVLEYVAFRAYKAGARAETEGRIGNYYRVPVRLATRLVKNRSVLCRGGEAILFRDQVQEVFITVFQGHLNRGLHDAFLARARVQGLEEESEKSTVMAMLDAFLEQFIADPSDGLAEGASGTVRAGDVQYLAQGHFPLCMRQIDGHLRRDGHLKHMGRFSYGLFLKAIGLSLDDSMVLFATLMSQKGGGSVEAFAKLAYGYNVRHNYGMEGKKTSYNSASCGTILSMPVVVDKHDCHGCPFRFRDEGHLRSMLQKEQHSPKGKAFPDVRLMPGDIEDIITDAKNQHYTRACYKYFMKTHEGVKRDTLFRSPYEYYSCSRECDEEVGKEAAAAKGADDLAGGTPVRGSVGVKRTDADPILKEDVTRHRPE